MKQDQTQLKQALSSEGLELVALTDLAQARQVVCERERGFTLIELLVVVAIIAIIASIAIPNMIDAMDRAKQNSTMADMRVVGFALEKYAIDHNVYPTVADADELRAVLQPVYIKKMPVKDGWGNPLSYQADANGRGYRLTAPGKDGEGQVTPAGGEITSVDDDLIYADGDFFQWPARQSDRG